MTNHPLSGGCLCGAIRYQVDRVFDAGYCHCSRCRKGTGGAVLAWAYVEADAFRLTNGTPKAYPSSAEGTRCFCGQCGSPLYFEGEGGRYYSVHVGTLDDPERVPPQIHQCIETKLRWLSLIDDLPQVTGNTLPHPDKRRGETHSLSLGTIEEATAAVEYFNGFHDGFIRNLQVIAFDTFEDRDTQYCSGRLDLRIRFAHWNYDFAHGARPHLQEVEAEFEHVRDLEIRFGGRETDWSIKRLLVSEGRRARTSPVREEEACLRAVLVQPRLRDWTQWVESEDVTFTFTTGRIRELPLPPSMTP
jgi:hypothetical protein